jgi:hypothetical protein
MAERKKKRPSIPPEVKMPGMALEIDAKDGKPINEADQRKIRKIIKQFAKAAGKG